MRTSVAVVLAAVLVFGATAARAASRPLPAGNFLMHFEGQVMFNGDFSPASVLGSMTIDNAGNISGARTLNISGQRFRATFTCSISQDNGDGSGEIACRTNDAIIIDGSPIPVGARDDYFQFAVNGKDIRLMFLTGVAPGASEFSSPVAVAVLSGAAEQ